MTKQTPSQDGPLELNENQRHPSLARPEDFIVHQWDEQYSVSGQSVSHAPREKENRGSLRPPGNVDHAGKPHQHIEPFND
jgi:hypothetical protein